MKTKVKNIKYKKIISIFAIFSILLSLIINLIPGEVKAAQYSEPADKSTKLSNYPLYKELINNLKAKHPNWTFTIFYTGLDWNQVIKNETIEDHARNLVPENRTGEWLCSYCEANHRTYDEGRWKGASEVAVSYYMDPRNFLYEDYIFQFENLGYNQELHTLQGVNTILEKCAYLQGNSIKYIKTDGKTGTINKSYAQVILEAGKKFNVSPYHLASRIVQEQGTTGTEMVSGNYNSKYRGYYNFFNIGATGGDLMANGLEYAKKRGWTDPEKAINGGAEFIVEEYIQYGQTTLYFQKFDVVEEEEYGLYYNQYMQNVSAAKTEGEEVKSAYVKMGFVNSQNEVPFNFLIPVYENMPSEKCPYPGSRTIVTQDVEIINSVATVREQASSTSKSLGTLKVGAKVLRIEIGTSSNGGTKWDKVVLENGTKGYIISTNLKKINDITNCNEKKIANTDVNLRNGPGTTGTTVITTLTEGQAITVIEKDRYKNVDGLSWYRVKTANEQTGYLASKYLNNINSGSDGQGNELVKVISPSGLKVREKPGTSSNCLTIVPKGTILTRTQKAVSNANGYIWDKIVTGTGIVGYVARSGGNEVNIEVVNNSTPTTPTTPATPTIPNNYNFKVNGSNLVCIPNVTVDLIKKTCKDAIIKKGNTAVTSGNVATGYTITTGGKTYTIVVKGDSNGDGKVNSADALIALKHSAGVEKKTGIYLAALDVNKDGKTNSADALAILKCSAGLEKIKL